MELNQKQATINDLVVSHNVKRRTKRDLAADCKALEIASLTSGYAATVTSELAPSGPWGLLVSGIVVSAYTAKFGVDIAHIEMGCDDIPFNEVKEIMDKRFNKLDEAVDRNYNAILKVDQKMDKVLSEVQQTRIEMRQGFVDILDGIKKTELYSTLSDLKTFITDFDTEAALINDLPADKYIARINDTIKFLNDLAKERRRGDNTLYTIVNKIINQGFAIPKSADDNDAWSALYSIYYAAQTYVSIFLFLVKHYSRLADYYYNDGDIDQYNFYFNELETVFTNFKKTLTADSHLLDTIVEVIEKVKAKDFMRVKNDLRVSLNTKIEALKKMKIDILEMELSIIADEVDDLGGYSSFDGTSLVEDWANGGEVSYALQYKTGRLYSRIGKWTSFKFQGGQANPVIRIPFGPEGRQKLIFRKFNNNRAQLVGVIDDENMSEFHDIHRDLYNAVLYSGMNDTDAQNMIDTMLENGLDMDARFEHGRTAIHAAAESENKPVAKILLDVNPSYVNLPDDNGFTPLHIAAEKGDDKFIALLIEYGADVNAQTYTEKLTALHLAVRNGYNFAVKALLDSEKINIYARDADGLTPLHLSINRGIPFVKMFHDKNFNINVKAADGITLLHMAAMNKNLNFAKSLVKYSDFQVNSAATNKFTPLHFAVLAENLDMVKFLLQRGADVNAATSTNWTSLHFAVSLRNEDIVNTLLSQQDIKVDLKADGSTPFHLAVGSGQVRIAQKLLAKGANIQAITKYYATPLHIASMHKKVGMVEFLLRNNAKLEEKVAVGDDPAATAPGYTPLLTATLIGNLSVIEYLIGKGANINATEKNGDNILNIAAKNGHLNVVKYLENKFDIAHDPKVLKSAINSGQLHVVKYLIDEKKMNWNKKEIFDVAINSGHSSIVNYLIFHKKYNVACVENDKCKYLNGAARFGYLDMVQYLTKNEYDNVKRIIHFAINYGQTHILDYYLDTGLITTDYLINYVYRYTSDLETAARLTGLKIVKYIAEKTNVSPDEMITSLLPLALEQHNLELIKYLVKDVDINGVVNVGIDGDSVLHCAVKKISWSENAKAVFRYLIDEKGANVNARNIYGDTVLNLAIKSKVFPLVEFLISRGVDLFKNQDWYMMSSEILSFSSKQFICNSIIKGNQVDITTLDKNSKCIDTTKRLEDVYYTTPLILAIWNGNINLANELIDNGVNLHLTDDAGNTPLHIAAEKGYLDLVNKLIQKGADVTVENKAFKIPLLLAYDNFNKPIIDALNAASKSYSRGKRSIQESTSPINVVKYLKNHGCHISDASEKEGTPLCLSNLNGKQETIEFKNPLCLQHNLSLGLLLLQNFLDKKYPLPRFTEMDSEKSRTFALEITFKFEKILRKAVKITHDGSSSLDFYKLFREIEANIRNEKFSNIPKVLVDFVNDVCTNEKTAESMVDKIGKWFSKV